MNFLDPSTVDWDKFMELATQPLRPKSIVELTYQIERSINAAELRLSITGEIDREEVTRIVNLKLKKDHLYTLWATGQLDNEILVFPSF